MGRTINKPVTSSTTISTRIQSGPYGTQNNAGRRRQLPAPILLQRGPVQGLEVTGNRQIDRVQQSIRQATSVIKSLPMAQGNMIENLSLSAAGAGNNTVGHGLGRPWKGALLCTPSAAVSYYVGSTSTPQDGVQLNVNVAEDVTCALWVW